MTTRPGAATATAICAHEDVTSRTDDLYGDWIYCNECDRHLTPELELI